MKKLLLFLAIGAIANTAMGQRAEKSIVMQPVSANTGNPEVVKYNAQNYIKDKAQMAASRAASKATLDGKRLHSYLDYLLAANSDLNAIFPYQWFGADMFGIYQGTSGLEADTITFVSYGTVLDAAYEGFNDLSVPNSSGKIYINNFNNYTVDSAYIYGIYGRNSTKTSIVDTMIISLVYGANIRQFSYTGQAAAAHNVDTLFAPGVRYNKITRTTDTFGSGNPLVITRKIPLTPASRNDSTSSGLTIIRAHFGANVQAGQLVAVTATFKTGEAYTPFSDTVFRGSVNPGEPFKYNLWRPAIYEENEGEFPTYTEGNYNCGVFKSMYGTDSANGYDRYYVPTFAYINADAAYEFPDIDILLSCIGCGAVNIANAPNTIKSLGAYPNPANNELSIPFALKNSSDVQVTLSSITGQVLKTQNMGNVSGGTAIFSTGDLANGMYIYTIKAAELSKSGRVTVAH